MEQLLSEDCAKCPWGVPDTNVALDRLMYYMTMQDGGCQVDRHELRNDEYIAIAAIKKERESLNAPKPEDYGWQKVPGKNGGD